ncbi:MAG: hypothetical protein P8N27_03230 [Polaribacter sp.]|uniref:hypothetical protein n=1 Tax=Polaribacter sp. TaxID=1920175 RepID=UPI002612D5F7|nr:hypothetical protein [Polaribacter sp.]MBT3741073.1 hypothetical protein [Polaribacter sp.]MDG1194504.1 hypothetical protein [Polaribacter sp.]MDG1402594.1 hypothetical protein [Polaribacter sp.]MDG2436270.1 hypothetical protein [Polaribacter sp.]
MKFLKFILVICISLAFTSCGDDSAEPPYALTKENIAGKYNLSSFNLDMDSSSEVSSGIFATFSSAKFVGDTFQLDLEMNSDGTYSLTGLFRVVSSISIVGGTNPTVPPLGINFNNSGNFSINNLKNTITFNSKSGNFLDLSSLELPSFEPVFNVTVFNENSYSITQEAENVNDKIKIKTNSKISFIRK